jgi:hypothetical protein
VSTRQSLRTLSLRDTVPWWEAGSKSERRQRCEEVVKFTDLLWTGEEKWPSRFVPLKSKPKILRFAQDFGRRLPFALLEGSLTPAKSPQVVKFADMLWMEEENYNRCSSASKSNPKIL